MTGPRVRLVATADDGITKVVLEGKPGESASDLLQTVARAGELIEPDLELPTTIVLEHVEGEAA